MPLRTRIADDTISCLKMPNGGRRTLARFLSRIDGSGQVLLCCAFSQSWAIYCHESIPRRRAGLDAREVRTQNANICHHYRRHDAAMTRCSASSPPAPLISGISLVPTPATAAVDIRYTYFMKHASMPFLKFLCGDVSTLAFLLPVQDDAADGESFSRH